MRVLFFLLLIFSCSKPKVELQSYQFEANWLSLKFTEAVKIKSISMFKEGTLLKRIPIHSQEKELSIPFAWESNTNYRLKVETSTVQKSFEVKTTELDQKLKLRLSLPFGQKAKELPKDALLRQNCIFSDSIFSHLQVHFPQGITDSIFLHIKSDEAILNHSKKIYFQKKIEPFEKRLDYFFHIKTLTNKPKKLDISLRYKTNKYFNTTLILKALKTDSLYKKIHILGHQTPSDIGTSFSPFNKENHFYLKDAFLSRLQSFFSDQAFRNETAPFTYYNLKLFNHSNEELLILGEIAILDPKTNKAHPAFTPTNWEMNSYNKISKSSIALPPQQEGDLNLAIYINEKLIQANQYPVKIKLFILGESKPFYEYQQNIYIQYEKQFRIILYGIFTLLGLFSFFYFIRKLPTIFEQLSIKLIVAISIFAAIHFILNFLVTLLDYSFLAILGPFKIFFSSFVSECLMYCIILSLYMLFPKQGVISLKLITSYILGIILGGGFYIFSIVTLGLNILFLEFIFKRFYSEKSLFPLAFFLAIYDMALSYFNILEFQVLYNVFYADWYILLYLFLIGFSYTFFGAYLGRDLARQLRKIGAT